MERPGLSESISHYIESRKLYRYFLLYIVLLVIGEAILGYAFSVAFVTRLEDQRRQEFVTAWERYFDQRTRLHYSKITGYAWWDTAWLSAQTGNYSTVRSLFNQDDSITDEFDLFSIYLSPANQILEIRSDRLAQGYQLPDAIVEELFARQSMREGATHFIVTGGNGSSPLLVSVSPLADNNGNPMMPGVMVFGIRIEAVFELAEQVIPVRIEAVDEERPSAYATIDLTHMLLHNGSFFVEFEPNTRMQSVTSVLLVVFIFIQLLIGVAFFGLLVPSYTRKRTAELRAMVQQSDELNQELKRKVDQLEEARAEILKSETKYRHLVEDSQDIIFTLSHSGTIESVNGAVQEFLGWRPVDVEGRHLSDLIYERRSGQAAVAASFLSQKIQTVFSSGGAESLHLMLRTRHDEPQDVQLSLQALGLKVETTVMAKASRIYDDAVQSITVSERMTFEFGNYLIVADQVGRRTTDHIAHYFKADDAFGIKMAVREMILNAIEHGNLGISFEQKTELTKQGTFLEFIAERQKDPFYNRRRVRVQYAFSPERISFVISDEGDGFDFKRIMSRDVHSPENRALFHGRGILLARTFFDVVRYRGTGNSVYLRRSINRE